MWKVCLFSDNFARFNDDSFARARAKSEWLFPNPATISLGNLLEIVFSGGSSADGKKEKIDRVVTTMASEDLRVRRFSQK